MATMAAAPVQRRKKPATYGKATTKMSYNTSSAAFLDDELAESDPPRTAQSNNRVHTMKNAYAVQKTETGTARPKAGKKRVDHVDTFDVPPSDDELEHSSPAKRTSPPRQLEKRNRITLPREEPEHLAPWEQQKEVAAAQKTQNKGDGAANQDTATPSKPVEVRRPRRTIRQGSDSEVPVPPASATSALSLLKSRREGAQAEENVVKKAGKPVKSVAVVSSTACDSNAVMRKRKRVIAQQDTESVDAIMKDGVVMPTCNIPLPVAHKDVFDFPDFSADELVTSAPTVESPPGSAKKSKRTRSGTSSVRSTPRKGASAPARLLEMLPSDDETTATSARTPSTLSSRLSTPQRPASMAKHRGLSTPPTKSPSSPEPAAQVGSMTPKQAQLWSQLLPSDPASSESPSNLPIEGLEIGGHKRTAKRAIGFRRTLTKSKSDVPRTRLVDRLKASAPNSDDAESSDDPDVEMTDAQMTEQNITAEIDQILDVNKAQASQASSDSASQPSAPADGGPRITYARTRSYLPEDDLEAALMFDIPSAPVPQPAKAARRPGKPPPPPSKTAFDIDESDDEAQTSQLRSIHELRAAGRNLRFADDADGLLREIANHNPSAKSRRRGALIELASKLIDRTYTSRFVSQGYDHRIVDELSDRTDLIADIVLAIVLTLILSVEAPEHTIMQAHQAGALDLLTALVDQDTAITKLAKERKYNMSKVAQSSLAELCEAVNFSEALWDTKKLETFSVRTLALKGLDLLVSKVRKSGHREELVPSASIATVASCLPDSDTGSRGPTEGLALSVLESLSTSAVVQSWPPTALEQIAAYLGALGDSTKHSVFLALRLTLNLTNDNARNCSVLAEEATVRCLLEKVVKGLTGLGGDAEEDGRALNLDVLVLAIGTMTNLAEHSDAARRHSISFDSTHLLSVLVKAFLDGQRKIAEAESVEQSASNVAYGYLAVMLGHLCQTKEVEEAIRMQLPGQELKVLVNAVGEFVLHHQKVDTMNFEGEEGTQVWGAFTERLKLLLAKLQEMDN